MMTVDACIDALVGAVVGMAVIDAFVDAMLKRHKWPQPGRFYVHARADLCKEYRYTRMGWCY